MKKLFVLPLLLLIATSLSAQRKETILRDGWKFSRGEKYASMNAIAPSLVGFNDSKWQTVQVPHDWAISGPFDKEIDKQTVAIEQNGEKQATEKTGRSGSLPWIGEGWYRTTFKVNKESQRVVLNFDGAMAEPDVYVNGEKVGEWKYGYTPFNIDITGVVNGDDTPNTLAVHLKNMKESSRWYPGAGLYRPVTLIQTGTSHILDWGINVETKQWNGKTQEATIALSADIADGRNCIVRFSTQDKTIDVTPVVPTTARLFTSNGNIKEMNLEYFDTPADAHATAEISMEDVECWSPEHPRLYDLTVSIIADGGKGEVLDTKTVKYGIRTVEVSGENGCFMLNGEARKIKGVCLHHDLGMIGTAVNKAALIRQVELLKSMGCDAIRTSHNTPSQMQMEVYDSLGMMVMAESFDMWQWPKCKNGYSRPSVMRFQNRVPKKVTAWHVRCRTSFTSSTPPVLSHQEWTASMMPSPQVLRKCSTFLASTTARIDTSPHTTNCATASCSVVRRHPPFPHGVSINSPLDVSTARHTTMGNAPAMIWKPAGGQTCQRRIGSCKRTRIG